MKKIRLFAVAAAMGMFATTVNAAPKVEKNAYVATWNEVEEIIKVDVNDKVVAPNASISVVKEIRTTDASYKTVDGTLALVGKNTCYKGFTNEVAKDANGDGLVDTPVLAMAKNTKDTGWYYTNAKFFPTAKTALFYVGYTGSPIYGARFLAAGSSATEGYAIAPTHVQLKDIDAVLDYLENEKLIERQYDSKDNLTAINLFKTTTYEKNKKGNKDLTKPLGTLVATWEVDDRRWADVELEEAVVEAFLNGGSVRNYLKSKEYASLTYNYSVTTGALGKDEQVEVPYTADFFRIAGDKTPIAKDQPLDGGKVYEIAEDRYGDFYVLGEATGTDLADKDGTKITLVEKNRDGSYSLFSRVTPKAITTSYTGIYSMKFGFDGIFEKVSFGAEAEYNATWGFQEKGGDRADLPQFDSLDEEDFQPVEQQNGLVHFEAVANTSDKIVINTHGTDLNLEIVNINKKKGTMTLTAPDGKTDIVVNAVELQGDWYPAVDSEKELVEFVNVMLGLHTPGENKGYAGSQAYTWEQYEELLTDVEAYSKITYLDGSVDTEYIPANGLAHYKAQQCTYKKAEGESATATITSNAEAVDTSTAGVKTLTLTAKVGDEVVGTKDIKVVVAPKYERVYKNGKVITLKAFHLNGALYAVYNYDWSAKKYTATFYSQDGVTVASSANGNL